MSVAAESSPIAAANKLLTKRTYEASCPPDAAATLATQPSALKRGRGAAGAGAPGDEPLLAGHQHPASSFHPADRAYALGEAARTALRGLFPEMSEQTVTEALYTCGDDIDAAVRRLSELRLRAGGGGGEEQRRAGAAPAALKKAAAAAAAAAAPSRDGTPAVDPARETPGPAGAAGTATASPPPAAATAAAGPSSHTAAAVDGWAESVVREMAVATDVSDALDRARTVLRGFAASLASADAADGGPAAASARAAALERDCGLLKRAVTLQAARLADAAQVRAQLEAAQGRVHALELANYGLAAHLRAAAGGAGSVLGGAGGGPGGGGGHGHGGHQHGGPPPDVF